MVPDEDAFDTALLALASSASQNKADHLPLLRGQAFGTLALRLCSLHFFFV